MAKKLAKTLCGLTIVMVAVGGVLAYLKTRDGKDSLDEDFDDFTDEFETQDPSGDQDAYTERTYTTLSKETKKEEASGKKDYSKMTLAELKAVAKEQGVKGYSTMKKDELLNTLK